MKKRKIYSVLAIFLTVLLLLTCGCGKNGLDDDPFSAFSEDFSAELLLEINESESACTYEKHGDTVKITFLSPDALSGFVFNMTKDGLSLQIGDTSVDANGKIGFLPRLLSAVFSESKENITEIKTEKADGNVLTVIKTKRGVYRFSQDGFPLLAEGNTEGATYKISFVRFSDVKDGGV